MPRTQISAAEALSKHQIQPACSGLTRIYQGQRVRSATGNLGSFVGVSDAGVIRIVWDVEGQPEGVRIQRYRLAKSRMDELFAKARAKAQAELDARVAAAAKADPKPAPSETARPKRLKVICNHGSERMAPILAVDEERGEYLVALRRYQSSPNDAIMAVVPMKRDGRWGRRTRRSYLTADKLPRKWARRIAEDRGLTEAEVREQFHAICMEAPRPTKGSYNRQYDTRGSY